MIQVDAKPNISERITFEAVERRENAEECRCHDFQSMKQVLWFWFSSLVSRVTLEIYG